MTDQLNRVLHVEDDLLIAEMVMMSLSELGGLTVKHCASGMLAVETAEDFGPELLLLDVMMPGMDGIETLQRLRQLPLLRETPAIFMSAKVQNHECEHYLKQGACGTIRKPFDSLSLPDQLQSLWANARHDKPAGVQGRPLQR